MFTKVSLAFELADPTQKAKTILAIENGSAYSNQSEINKQLLYAFDAERKQHKVIQKPGIPKKPLLADPRNMPKRKLGSEIGLQAMIHAIAHIEFSAINLALDAIQRYPEMPLEYHHDWLSVAQDESKHFLMLSERLNQLGCEYGDFEAHDGLWALAEATKDNVLDRMAIVPRMMEARGLDMNPQIMKKLTQIGDNNSVELLKIILRDEINHVSIGNKWFHYCCGMNTVSPDQTFMDKFQQYFTQTPKGALNVEARIKAGFTYDELDYLQDLAAGKISLK
jgi:uncharacterized ferritin-like protein (DUF455 family)